MTDRLKYHFILAGFAKWSKSAIHVTLTRFFNLARAIGLIVLTAAGSHLVFSCSDSQHTSSQPDTVIIEDMAGRQVAIPEEVSSVIGLRAGALRMLVYLDAIDQVAGIEEPERHADRPYLTAHPCLRDLPSVGPIMGGDAEMLVVNDPDVIFLTFTTAGQADDLQARTGIPVIALDYGDFSLRRDTFFASLRLMASVLGKEERAESLIEYIHRSLDELENRTENIPDIDRPRAYVGGISYSGIQGISSTEPRYPPFRFLQVDNVASGIDERLVNPVAGTFIDKEQLIMWDPDVLFVDLASLPVVRNEISPGSPLHATLRALRNGEVYGVLPYNNYAANYEAILANAWYAGKVLYPDRFSDLEVTRKADEIFEMFLGRAVYKQVSEIWGGFRKLDQELL